MGDIFFAKSLLRKTLFFPQTTSSEKTLAFHNLSLQFWFRSTIFLHEKPSLIPHCTLCVTNQVWFYTANCFAKHVEYMGVYEETIATYHRVHKSFSMYVATVLSKYDGHHPP